MNCKCVKDIDEKKYGLWWGIEWWLIRKCTAYDETQNQMTLFQDLFGDRQEDWEKMSIQFRRMCRIQIAEDCKE